MRRPAGKPPRRYRTRFGMNFGLGQFTLQLPPWDTRSPAQLYADTLELAAFAEQAGFSSFWLAEHHGASDDYNPALLPFLSAVAARTTSMQIGTAVLLAPLHHPLRLAEDAAVVDAISGGRLNLGLGLGWVPDEYAMFGVPMAGRGKRFDEIIQILRLAWSGEPFDFEGRFYDFHAVTVRPRPAHPIPIWLGGGADAAIERAAILGDGHFPASVAGGAAIVERAEQIRAIREREGLTGPYRYGAFLPVGLGSDPDDGWAGIRAGVMHVRGAYMMWAQGQRDVARAVESLAENEPAVRAGAVAGTPAQVVDALAPIVEGIRAAGFEHSLLSVILAPPGTALDVAKKRVETFATSVMPAFA